MIRRPLLCLALLLLAACGPTAPLTPLPPEPTATQPPPTETPTPTTVWFPPTATYTPNPTQGPVPTEDLSAEVGRTIFKDDFSEPGSWSLGKTQAGSAALGKKELTLHVSEPEGYVFSLRQEPLLEDFYLEITASPSICRPEDEYGLLLRFSQVENYYRFVLTCSGEYRLDLSLDGFVTSPQPATLSGAVPPGAPSQSRLAVWMKGEEMRFFANSQELFTLTDGALSSGVLGLFTRAAGENVVTVSFSDMTVRETR
jgi:hypothetical protein